MAQPWGTAARSDSKGHSVRIVGRDEPIYVAPNPQAKRRGALQAHARLPIYAATAGPGCAGDWLMVGPLAWVCSERTEPSAAPPAPAVLSPPAIADGLPYRYHFVGQDGSFGYRDLATAEMGTPDVQIEPGFVVAIRRTKERFRGDPFGLTTKGYWVPVRDLVPIREFGFAGEQLGGTRRVGWVYTSTADAFAKPGGRRTQHATLSQFAAVDVVETQEHGRHSWYRIAEDRWMSDQQLRVASPAPMPADLLPNERWIDIDLDHQVLTAFAGERPVFATLVSSGRGREGTEQATPKGEFRIWVKLSSSDMDNLEHEEANRFYAIQDVPWVMYFSRGYGLHGTFWHRSFGRVRSHGCVNLAPLDAQWLFHWTSPRLPTGWSAVLPTEYDPGTLVRVR